MLNFLRILPIKLFIIIYLIFFNLLNYLLTLTLILAPCLTYRVCTRRCHPHTLHPVSSRLPPPQLSALFLELATPFHYLLQLSLNIVFRPFLIAIIAFSDLQIYILSVDDKLRYPFLYWSFWKTCSEINTFCFILFLKMLHWIYSLEMKCWVFQLRERGAVKRIQIIEIRVTLSRIIQI